MKNEKDDKIKTWTQQVEKGINQTNWNLKVGSELIEKGKTKYGSKIHQDQTKEFLKSSKIKKAIPKKRSF